MSLRFASARCLERRSDSGAVEDHLRLGMTTDLSEEAVMAENLAAETDVTIRGSLSQVWDALVNPDKIRRYMFGATVESEWQVGAPIVWRGEWKGKPFEDKGRILELQRERRLRYSHFSALSGAPDCPESYHTVTIQMDGPDGAVHVELSQDNNPTEEACEASRRSWSAMLDELKKTVESEA
jgi:uncharacterized protein YndB with AHSA1/START domain